MSYLKCAIVWYRMLANSLWNMESSRVVATYVAIVVPQKNYSSSVFLTILNVPFLKIFQDTIYSCSTNSKRIDTFSVVRKAFKKYIN